jgi:preprotein translocase subunit YajC
VTVIAASGGSSFFLIIIVAFALLWLLVVRPQRKRQTKQQQMLSDLSVGDEVLTAGGIYGTVSQIGEDAVTVEIAPKLEVRVARRAIAGITREPEPEPTEEEEAAEPEEPVGDPDGPIPAGDTSNEENRG